ncbi:MAG: 30S ribosomal protein S8 [Candidatus Pacearchaeota archaeon]|nr:30S ribosomal protein S8 [Candidatus Pacearchaeota archaeon]
MSQDIVSDALNQIMNAKRSNRNSVKIRAYSKFFISILAIGKLRNYIEDYKSESDGLVVNFGKLNVCKAVKPRYIVKAKMIDKYVRRYLPARDMGVLIISTSKGLMTHQTALEKNLGGSIIAYFY